MLSLRTTENWASLIVDVTVAPDPAETFTATKTSGYEAMVEWLAWLNAAGRAWTGVATFSWSWVRDPATGGAWIILSATGALFTLDAGAFTTLGIAATGGAVATITSTQAVLGSWAPSGRMAVSRHIRSLGAGDASADGVVRPGVPGAGHFEPSMSAVGTAIDAGRLAEIFAVAENPRVAVVYQLHTDEWLTLAMGPISRAAATTHHYRFEFEAAGEVLA